MKALRAIMVKQLWSSNYGQAFPQFARHHHVFGVFLLWICTNASPEFVQNFAIFAPL
jgi:hypothetical protein